MVRLNTRLANIPLPFVCFIIIFLFLSIISISLLLFSLFLMLLLLLLPLHVICGFFIGLIQPNNIVKLYFICCNILDGLYYCHGLPIIDAGCLYMSVSLHSSDHLHHRIGASISVHHQINNDELNVESQASCFLVTYSLVYSIHKCVFEFARLIKINTKYNQSKLNEYITQSTTICKSVVCVVWKS